MGLISNKAKDERIVAVILDSACLIYDWRAAGLVARP